MVLQRREWGNCTTVDGEDWERRRSTTGNYGKGNAASAMIDRETARACDRYAIEQLKIPGLVLMENAGRGCAEHLHQWAGEPAGARALILCGPGNNGGDGMVIARHLRILGWQVKVVLLTDPAKYRGDALTMLRPLWQLPLEVVTPDQWLGPEQVAAWQVGDQPADWVIDAMLGTGATGLLRQPLEGIVRAANGLSVRRCAVDLPTGVDCDTEELPEVFFRPDLTCTLIDRKPGLANLPGEVKVIHIGAAADWLTAGIGR